MRIFVAWFASMIHEEKVKFQESGGFKADRKAIKMLADDYPEEFKRTFKGPMDFERFLVRYGFENKPLPAERGWGKMVLFLVLALAFVVGLLVMVLPAAMLEDVQRRWAFYGG